MEDYVKRVDEAAKEYADDFAEWPIQVRRLVALAFTHGATFGLGEARKLLKNKMADSA